MNSHLSISTHAARIPRTVESFPSGEKDSQRRAELIVFEAARRVEPNLAAIRYWYTETPIHALDNRCAIELVRNGCLADVLAFIQSID